jgi:hypothetical protein
MWLFGAFISAEDAAFHGAVYLASRFFFLPFWASGGKWNVLIELSTQPCYAVLNLWKVGNARSGFFSFTVFHCRAMKTTLSVLPRPRAAARGRTQGNLNLKNCVSRRHHWRTRSSQAPRSARSSRTQRLRLSVSSLVVTLPCPLRRLLSSGCSAR